LKIYLSLGSNLHPRHYYIDEACKYIEERCGTILRRSDDFFSMPQGYQSDNEYLNICLKLETDKSPLEILKLTQQIERDLGRTIKNHYQDRTIKNNYQDRTIDIDLLQVFDQEGREILVSSNDLTLPHPRMQDRDFVLVPLSQIT